MKKFIVIAGIAIMAITTSACFSSCGGGKKPPIVTPGNTITPENNEGKITLNKSSLSLKINERATLVPTIANDVKVKIVNWSSSNNNVATVSGTGDVTGVSAGTAVITAKVEGSFAICNVTVTKEEVKLSELEVKITGSINHTTYTEGDEGSVIFNRFPATMEEFKQVREKIGREPHGGVALHLMALEMFRRNRTLGEQCIKLVNVSSHFPGVIRQAKENFGGDVNYNRPYQVAAFLEGATPENGYNPTKPYTIKVTADAGTKYVYSNTHQTEVLYLRVACAGGGTYPYRKAAVLKTANPNEQSNDEYFIMFEAPGLQSQVAPISFKAKFNGLD